ncbi:hypothetical protein RBWH47_05418 [Rhodopirellula baltica WH47]|nr:hypothetical protein RBWH47_05418 [Rhodopirellula baltica WH47]
MTNRGESLVGGTKRAPFVRVAMAMQANPLGENEQHLFA